MSKDTKSVMEHAITAIISQPLNPDVALKNDMINRELFNIKDSLSVIENCIAERKQDLEDV